MTTRTKTTAKQPPKSRKFGTATLPTGPLKATESFGLTTSANCWVEPNGAPQFVLPHSKDFHRSTSPDSLKIRRERSSVAGLIHRSSSFDAISSIQYLSGTWPRAAGLNNRTPLLSSTAADLSLPDNETQAQRSSSDLLSVPPNGVALSRSSSLGVGDDHREARLSKSVEPASFFIGAQPLSSLMGGSRKNSRGKGHRHRQKYTPRHSRGSLEGLNQELERLSVVTSSTESSKNDGRRAPVTDLLVCDTECATTNLLYSAAAADESDALSSAVSFVSLQDSGIDGVSPAPTGPSSVADESPESQSVCSLSDHDSDGSNLSPPKFNLTRLPPDGCESIVCKVNEKGLQLASSEPAKPASLVIKPIVVRAHIPSEKSAFYPPLLDKYIRRLPAQQSHLVTSSPDHARLAESCE